MTKFIQYSKIKKDNHPNIDYRLNEEGDSIWIKSSLDSVNIYKVRIIHSKSQKYWDFADQSEHNTYNVPLVNIPVGNCTVVAYDNSDYSKDSFPPLPPHFLLYYS